MVPSASSAPMGEAGLQRPGHVGQLVGARERDGQGGGDSCPVPSSQTSGSPSGAMVPGMGTARRRCSSRVTPSFPAAAQDSTAAHRVSRPISSSSVAPSHRHCGPDRSATRAARAGPGGQVSPGPCWAKPGQPRNPPRLAAGGAARRAEIAAGLWAWAVSGRRRLGHKAPSVRHVR